MAIGAVALMTFTGCTSSSDGETTTTVAPITTLSPSTTSTTQPAATTLAPIRELDPPSYRIVDRQPIEGAGDEVVVLLDPASYDTLTDLDLYDLIAEVVELFPPVSVLHVVDSAEAANAVVNAEATDAERASLALNYLARLDDGFRVTYLGPFAASGSAVLGS
jgi:hypothetical protein